MRLLQLAGISLLTLPTARAEDVKLPPTMTFTAYDTGTAGFNISVAVGKMMKDKYGTDVRVLPAGNDVARLAPLRAGRAMSSAMGSGTYFAQEGVFEFGAREWGPQPLQLVLSSIDCNGRSFGVARDTGVTEIKQLQGKRVGFVVGSPLSTRMLSPSWHSAASSRSDVKIVEFASYGAMWKGLINNDADAAFATTITGPATEVETSPRGLIWPPLPHKDNAGWERVQKVGCILLRHWSQPAAPAFRKEKPIELGQLPVSDFRDLRFAIGRPGLRRHQGDDRQATTSTRMPPPGAAGLGGRPPDQEMGGARSSRRGEGPQGSRQLERATRTRTTTALFKRQGVLAAAWADYGKSNPPSDDKEFLAGWMTARAAALAKGQHAERIRGVAS